MFASSFASSGFTSKLSKEWTIGKMPTESETTVIAAGRIATLVEEVHHVIPISSAALSVRPNSRSGKYRRRQGDRDRDVLVAGGRQLARII